jgi:uncharacterized protein YigE (DUF2233 family)
MKKITVILCLLASSAFADEFTVTHVADRLSGLHATVISIDKASNRGFVVHDALIKRERDTIRRHWDGHEHLLMINGGSFQPDFTPAGFCKLNGKVVRSGISKKLSGFVAIDQKGKISLLTKADNLSRYPSVFQAGPYVIEPGGNIGIKSRDSSVERRTLVGKTTDGKLLIIVTKPIALYDLAVEVKAKIPKVERLLNLDGGSSTALKTKSLEVLNKWPVRNYIAMKKR